MPSLVADYRTIDRETAKLLNLFGTLGSLSPKHQKLVSEIILLRLFDLFLNLVSSVAAKVACGASYVDGTLPTPLTRATSINHAKQLFQSQGRKNAKMQLRWSTARDIKDNIGFVLGGHENLVLAVDRSSLFIDELRRIRNRIAHSNKSSRSEYQVVVRRHYGANRNQVTPGLLLATPRFRPALLERYLRETRVFAKDFVKI